MFVAQPRMEQRFQFGGEFSQTLQISLVPQTIRRSSPLSMSEITDFPRTIQGARSCRRSTRSRVDTRQLPSGFSFVDWNVQRAPIVALKGWKTIRGSFQHCSVALLPMARPQRTGIEALLEKSLVIIGRTTHNFSRSCLPGE